MKRFATLMLAALFVAAFALPAAALEHEFGGYWNTRFFSQNNFTGEEDTGAGDADLVQTRTRLYYTAILNDNLKFVNKFEFDATWGDQAADIGADGKFNQDISGIELKNSYVVFNMDNLETRVGIQAFQLGRGFIIDEDAAGIIAIYTVRPGLYLGFSWLHAEEGYVPGNAGGSLGDQVDVEDLNDLDVDSYTFKPVIYLSKEMSIAPYINYAHSRNVGKAVNFEGAVNNYNVTNLGLDFDMNTETFSFWATGIIQYGEIEPSNAALAAQAAGLIPTIFEDGDDVDTEGYILALGGAFNTGMGEVHGRFVYASGDESDPTDSDFLYLDGEFNAFLQNGDAASYYWAEIMGQGMFDNLSGGALNASNNAPGDDISNIWFGNLGAQVKPMEKMEVALDLWYAELTEDVPVLQRDGTLKMEDELGFEVDLRVSFELVENLNLDLVAAYLFAGGATERDAIGVDTDGDGVDDSVLAVDDANPWEMGAMLSLAF